SATEGIAPGCDTSTARVARCAAGTSPTSVAIQIEPRLSIRLSGTPGIVAMMRTRGGPLGMIRSPNVVSPFEATQRNLFGSLVAATIGAEYSRLGVRINVPVARTVSCGCPLGSTTNCTDAVGTMAGLTVLRERPTTV